MNARADICVEKKKQFFKALYIAIQDRRKIRRMELYMYIIFKIFGEFTLNCIPGISWLESIPSL